MLTMVASRDAEEESPGCPGDVLERPFVPWGDGMSYTLAHDGDFTGGELWKSDYMKSVQPFPGVRELLQRLRDDGYRLLVATSATEEDLKSLLKITGACQT